MDFSTKSYPFYNVYNVQDRDFLQNEKNRKIQNEISENIRVFTVYTFIGFFVLYLFFDFYFSHLSSVQNRGFWKTLLQSVKKKKLRQYNFLADSEKFIVPKKRKYVPIYRIRTAKARGELRKISVFILFQISKVFP